MLPYAKKSLGQHWLTDPASLEAIADAADVSSGDTVLEIGPGTGTLTDVLLDKGAEIIALEFDQERAQQLKKKYQDYDSSTIFIQQGDIRTYDFSNLPQPYKIVANIPYYLTANLLRKLVDDQHKPSIASLLVQKEVAERLSARPGKLSLIAVLVQNFFEVSTGEIILKDLFSPPPKVDSQVLILKLRAQPMYKWDNHEIQIIKSGFSEKRKKLKSSLSSSLKGRGPQEIEAILTSKGINENARAQELTLEQWDVLTSLFR